MNQEYALYEKTGTSDITIIDPKAHGIGLLYPPQDSPNNWKKDVPEWTYQLWDYIVRGALGFHRANFIRKLVRGLPVKRNSYVEFMQWLTRYNSAA